MSVCAGMATGLAHASLENLSRNVRQWRERHLRCAVSVIFRLCGCPDRSDSSIISAAADKTGQSARGKGIVLDAKWSTSVKVNLASCLSIYVID